MFITEWHSLYVIATLLNSTTPALTLQRHLFPLPLTYLLTDYFYCNQNLEKRFRHLCHKIYLFLKLSSFLEQPTKKVVKLNLREEMEGGFVHKMIRVRNKSKNWTNSLEDISLVKKFKFTCCVSNFTLEQLQIMFAFFNPKLSVKIKFA